MKPIILAWLFAAGALLTARAQSPLADFARRDTSVHDPSTIVRCAGEYWLFATGRGIVSRHSKDLKHWEAGPLVFSNVPAWTTNTIHANHGHFWAPDVFAATNGYFLYYAVSSWGKRDSVIGLATNATLDPTSASYHWTDCGPVIRTTENDDYNAIDPAALRTPEGQLWLAFGSYWSGIKLIELNPETGRRIREESPIFPLAHHDSIEASYIYFHDDYYYLFVNWGQCCRGAKSTYNIRLGRSKDVIGPYLDKEGHDLLHDGGTLFLQTQGEFIGPGHAGIIVANGADFLSCHFYDGSRGGLPTLGILPLRWDAEGWPEAQGPAQ
ncbi:MAG TPA: arabinan endo-1,5-alpha-L-arabinosidase [Verrucomicrobiae bacterium]|jgi:arabinan endo-1,5-alpha-L-arabinosidase|nr:arabinan endo-1,5-alpha-L-arabinosidase [Verrucomicrobiae bacterium]